MSGRRVRCRWADDSPRGLTERTHLLLAILRNSAVPAIKLELSTAEMSAYISQSKMKILREIYAVAKEEQRRGSASGELAETKPESCATC